jgi:hypothetical protein
LKHCHTGASPQELQIRALKQAMSILSSHAQDSRERVERLRTVLANRKVEPEVYEKFQRERWMEEKRQLAVNEETKVVLRYLEVLNESSHDDTYVPCVPDPPAPALTAEARRDANLLMFLASTRTQAPIRTNRPSSMSFEHTLRRRTMDRVTPMKLRSSFTSPALVGNLLGSLNPDRPTGWALPPPCLPPMMRRFLALWRRTLTAVLIVCLYPNLRVWTRRHRICRSLKPLIPHHLLRLLSILVTFSKP